MDEIKLTQYSHGAGCGCKIAPAVLDTILHSAIKYDADKNLLVGNDTRDDAAVYDLGDGNAIISTTDFFMPIVDDPYDFGRIASANAISDVYAMGGKPILAIAILGWPINKIDASIAKRLSEKENFLLLPTINYTVSFEHTPFFNLSIKESTLRLVLVDLCLSLFSNKVNTIFIINGHYGNLDSLKCFEKKQKKNRKIKIFSYENAIVYIFLAIYYTILI